MSVLQNKIDFVAFVSVKNANPNGDPLNGNRPRTNYSGLGEMSDVSLKRKLRNRLQDMGEDIFVQMAERSTDGCDCLSTRSKQITGTKTREEYAAKACEKWYDVRAFGQVFAFKAEKKAKESDTEQGVSIGVRGPVSIHQAISADLVDIESIQITKSVNSEPADKKSSDTMGMKHMVNFGLYKIKGAVNVQLAEKTGFSEEDAEKLKEALRTLFINDSSAARPEGSMEVVKIYWWVHSSKIGVHSSAKVHASVEAKKKPDINVAQSADDYEFTVSPLEGLEPEIIDGI